MLIMLAACVAPPAPTSTPTSAPPQPAAAGAYIRLPSGGSECPEREFLAGVLPDLICTTTEDYLARRKAAEAEQG
jgi:hypothetical protein